MSNTTDSGVISNDVVRAEMRLYELEKATLTHSLLKRTIKGIHQIFEDCELFDICMDTNEMMAEILRDSEMRMEYLQNHVFDTSPAPDGFKTKTQGKWVGEDKPETAPNEEPEKQMNTDFQDALSYVVEKKIAEPLMPIYEEVEDVNGNKIKTVIGHQLSMPFEEDPNNLEDGE